MKIPKLSTLLLLLVLSSVFTIDDASARAGGGGGGGGGSSSSSSSYSSSGNSSPFEVVLVIIIFLLLIYCFVVGVYGAVEFSERTKKLKNLIKQFKINNPTFSESDFLEKVDQAFLTTQEGWSKKDLSEARRYISDGVYQRFSTQFVMMDLLQQENKLSNIKIKHLSIGGVREDGAFDILDVQVMATLNDQFICQMNPNLNSGGKEFFFEVWSFIRKKNHQDKNIYSSANCPQCSAPLPDSLGDRGNCLHCNSLVNSGEYDWVLSEITQAIDYKKQSVIRKANNLKHKVSMLSEQIPDFSVQNIEDKASNAYFQIRTAYALNSPDRMRRFLSDTTFAKLKDKCVKNKFLYNRIYLRDVSLQSVRKEDNTYYLALSVDASLQRVTLKDKKVQLFDRCMFNFRHYLIMSREIGGEPTLTSVYTHQCTTCGSTIEDSLDINCVYCSMPLNSPKSEWIVSDYLDKTEYEAYLNKHKRSFEYKANPKLLDSPYSEKDYALNNLMILVAADGKFDRYEKAYVEEVAKKWRFKLKDIQSLFEMAQSGRLSIRMPESRDKCIKVHQLLVSAAKIDGVISKEEQEILNDIENQFILSDQASL